MSIKNFPRGIYLDTNILRRMPLKDPGTSFLELKKWTEESKTPIIIPDAVWAEWFHDFSESIKKKEEQTKANLRDFEILLGLTHKDFKLPEDWGKRLTKVLQDKLSTWGISRADTPKNISLEELVVMSAFKIRPFVEKSEKGFRDTIILYTILEDMKKRKIKDAVLVSDDSVFTHDDVAKIVERYKINLEIIDSLEGASTYIKNVTDEKVKAYIEMKKNQLVAFVKTKESEIFQFIKQNAELTEDFITKGGFLSSKQDVFGQIERVVKLEPLEVESAFNSIRTAKEKNLPKNIQEILISVKTHLKIEYAPFLPFNSPAVKVQDLSRFKEVVRSSSPRYYGDLTEKDLDRDITVSALAEKDEKGEYSNLILQRVNTF